MKKPTPIKKRMSSLRKKAEQALKKQAGRIEELSKQDMRHLIHELGTHQIELEMQNEELRRVQVEFEASRRKYADLYDFAPVGYFMFDRKGIILETNLTGATLLGMNKRLLLNKPFSRFIEGIDGLRSFSAHLESVLQKGTKGSCELRLQGKNGARFYAQLQSIPAEDDKGDITSIRTAVSDITERKQAEDEIRRLNEELKRSVYELQAVNRELEAFSYTVSNDLKAPLRSIEGFNRALLEEYSEKLDETGRDYLRRVNSAGRRMAQLIDAMLTIARLTRGELREKTVNLSDKAGIVVRELKKKAPERSVEFIIAENVKAKGDDTMLQIVMENLLDNAWKFTSKHPSARIEFGVNNLNGKDIYYVRDDGAGFEMAFADKLFLPFKRLHTFSEFSGIGIGLAIAHRIVSRHGGRMWAEGGVEKGATVYFTLG